MSAVWPALRPAKPGFFGSDIVSLCRAATQKELTGPDVELNADVVASVKKGRASPEAAADALIGRLAQRNPHKQWLAVELVKCVLEGAPDATRGVRDRVLAEVEAIASSPMNRYGSDLKAQQAAKAAAFKLVSSMANGGGGGAGGVGDPSPRSVGPRGTNPAQARKRIVPKDEDGKADGGAATPTPAATPTLTGRAGRWQRVVDAAAAGDTAGRKYVASLQGALTTYAGAAAKGDAGGAASAAADADRLAREMRLFGGAMAKVLTQMATFDGPDAEALTARCLACVDTASAALALRDLVLPPLVVSDDEEAEAAVEAAPAPPPPPAQPAAGAVPPPLLRSVSDLAAALDEAAVLTPTAAAAANNPFAPWAAVERMASGGDPFAPAPVVKQQNDLLS